MVLPEMDKVQRIFGLDLSKKTFTACLMENGKRKPTFTRKMTEDGWLDLCSMADEHDVIIMEGGSTSFCMARFIQSHSEAYVGILNPAKLHIIFESMNKTDANDAIRLATFVRDISPSYWPLLQIPTEEESSYRTAVTSQIAIKQYCTQQINRLHGIFTHNGITQLRKSDLADSNRRWDLVENLLPTEFSKVDARICCRLIDDIELASEDCEEQCRKVLMERPKEALAWLSLPGVGLLTAAACVAFIGDGTRFSDAGQLRNYVGLVPRMDCSGERNVVGGCNGHGCMPVRRNIVQAAWTVGMLARENTLTSRWHRYITRGKKGQKTAVSVANELLTIGWTLLKKGELYNGFGDYTYLETKLARLRLKAIDTSMYDELR